MEYEVTIDGCPYAFATAGCASNPTSDDPSWSSDWVTAVGHLAWPEGSIRYAMRPDGSFDAGPLSFTLHDKPIDIGPLAGTEMLATRLLTKHHTRVVRTSLETIIQATTTSFDVGYAAALPLDEGGVVWIDGEAILVGAPTGNTIPITGGVAGRGYYGSRPRDHAATAKGTEVWAEFPFTSRRRCLLWEVDDSGVATVLWRGYLEAGTATRTKGSDYSLPAKHVWTVINELDLGSGGESAPKITGYDTLAVKIMTRINGTQVTWDSYFSTGLGQKYCGSGQELETELTRRLAAYYGYPTPPARIPYSVRFSGGALTFTSTAIGPGGAIGISINGEETWGDGTSVPVEGGGTSPLATVTVPLPSIARALLFGGPATLVVDDVSDLPTSFGGRNSTTDGYSGWVRQVLRAPVSDTAWLVMQPDSVDASVTPPTITGNVQLVPRMPGSYSPEQLGATPLPIPGSTAPANVFYISEPLAFAGAIRTTADHWLYDIRFNITNDTNVTSLTPTNPSELLGERIDPRDWTWSTAQDVIRHTANAPNARTLFLDGKQKAGPYITDKCLPNGCAVAVRERGCLAIVAIRPPLDTDEIAASVTGSDYASRGDGEPVQPELFEQPEALINSAVIEAPDASVKVNEINSQRRYGPGRQVRVKLAGVETLAAFGSPLNVANSITSRLTGMWSEPVQIMRFQLTSDYQAVMVGDRLLLENDDVLPDGLGGRGIARGRMLVCSYVRPFREGGMVTLECWRWTIFGFAGYSVASRLESIDDNTFVLSRSYLDCASTKNYDGSDPVTGDGGARHWKVNYRVRIMLLDSATDVSESLGRVTAVDTTTRTITVEDPIPTSPNDWPALIAAGRWVDVIFDRYSTIVTVEPLADEQRGYAWIGGPSGGSPPYTISPSEDEAKRWAP